VSVGTRNLRREFSKSLKEQRASFNYSRAKARGSLSISRHSSEQEDNRYSEKDGVIIQREEEIDLLRSVDPSIVHKYAQIPSACLSRSFSLRKLHIL